MHFSVLTCLENLEMEHKVFNRVQNSTKKQEDMNLYSQIIMTIVFEVTFNSL